MTGVFAIVSDIPRIGPTATTEKIELMSDEPRERRDRFTRRVTFSTSPTTGRRKILESVESETDMYKPEMFAAVETPTKAKQVYAAGQVMDEFDTEIVTDDSTTAKVKTAKLRDMTQLIIFTTCKEISVAVDAVHAIGIDGLGITHASKTIDTFRM